MRGGSPVSQRDFACQTSKFVTYVYSLLDIKTFQCQGMSEI